MVEEFNAHSISLVTVTHCDSTLEDRRGMKTIILSHSTGPSSHAVLCLFAYACMYIGRKGRILYIHFHAYLFVALLLDLSCGLLKIIL